MCCYWLHDCGLFVGLGRSTASHRLAERGVNQHARTCRESADIGGLIGTFFGGIAVKGHTGFSGYTLGAVVAFVALAIAAFFVLFPQPL